jgi:6-phospho-3-hexuloisomerase
MMSELSVTFDTVDPGMADAIARELLSARRIVCFGLGREGLMIRACCMRLMHLGLDVHVASDVTAPPVGPGDLLFTSSGPGNLSMMQAMLQLAHRAGARIIVLTAQPDSSDALAADAVFVIPAQTMASDLESGGMLAMGTAYEIAMLMLLDVVAIRIRELSGQSLEDQRARHTNLE